MYEAMPISKPVVAVLDDEPEMRKALRRLLTGRGFIVEEYANGNDLIAAIGSRPTDCILLDLHMPEVSGFDVLENLSIPPHPHAGHRHHGP